MPSRIKKKYPDQTPKCHVRVGDKVVVLSGDSKGKQGIVIKVFPREQRALLEGEAAIFDTKHVKPNTQANKPGGREQKLRPMHLSKLALVDPTTGKGTRVRHAKDDKGNSIRVATKSGHKFAASAKA